MFLCLFLKISPILTRLKFKFKIAGWAPKALFSMARSSRPQKIRERPLRDSPPSSLDQVQSSRQKRSVDNTGPLEDHNWPQYFRDPCDQPFVKTRASAWTWRAWWVAGRLCGRGDGAQGGGGWQRGAPCLLTLLEGTVSGQASVASGGQLWLFDFPEAVPELTGTARVLPEQKSPESPSSTVNNSLNVVGILNSPAWSWKWPRAFSFHAPSRWDSGPSLNLPWL